jgi:cysteinyl-tRNA synthetase
MTIYIYNSLTKKKEEFVPINKQAVTFYVCGVTVYDYCHIGHARAYVAFDTIRRYLEYVGYKVNYIQNFTDIDDKIIKRANAVNLSFDQVSNKYITAYFEDMELLNIKKARLYPKATNYIEQMIQIIIKLIDKKHAYVLNGDVYFSVESFREYGKLSHKNLTDLLTGVRIALDENKRSPLDFALWKAAKPNEPFWESPWGQGRPGWHIECSAMILKELGDSIDIHAGGEDLVFPHHENEIAQSECYTNKPFVKYWLHNGFVVINNEKMSKSKNNFFTIRDILKKFEGETIRFFLLKLHYRAPLNFSFEGLEEAQHALQRFYNTFRHCPVNRKEKLTTTVKNDLNNYKNRFFEAMNNDFNYAQAIGVLFELNKYINLNSIGSFVLFDLGQVLGLFKSLLDEPQTLNSQIETLVAKRSAAKLRKDYVEADKIRDQLLNEYQIVLEDTVAGVKWRKL